MKQIFLIVNLLLFIQIVFVNCDKTIELNEDNWRMMLKGEWMVEFYAPWCPACKSLEPTWSKFSELVKRVSVAKIDVTKSPGLSGRFFVTALPTIYHVIDGEFRQYRSARDIQQLIEFISDEKYVDIEKVSNLKHPDSIQMTIVSYFFKLSHYLKEVNATLQNEYGLPVWASYTIFAIMTICIGAILGLILVCIIDFIVPPRTTHRKSFSQVQEQEKDKENFSGIDEIRGDDLEDENEGALENSDAEKYSGSDDDSSEEEKIVEEKTTNNVKKSPPPSPKNNIESSPKKTSPNASPDVRKRKPRKEN